MPTINEMIDFCEEWAAYDCFDNEQFKRREMFYAISDELKKSLREQKRPHGEWVLDKEISFIFDIYECSKCRFNGSKRWHFCPNCGADMREGDGE